MFTKSKYPHNTRKYTESKHAMYCIMCPLHRSKASSRFRLSLSKCKGTIGMFHK